MTELENLKLSDIMPPNLLKDPFIKAMCDALDVQLNKLVENNKKLSIYANIDNLPEEIINFLAWQFHVDFFYESWTLKQKRDAVKNSIKWHRYKGSIGVLEDYISTIFGNARVIEWFDYDGEPYHFKIDMITGEIPSIEALNKILKAIYTIKNTRSWCDGLGFLRAIDNKIYIGLHQSQFKQYHVKLDQLNNTSLKSTIYTGNHVNQFKKINIDVAKYLEDTTFKTRLYLKPYLNIFKKYTINTNTINAIHITQDLSFVSNINSFKQYKLKLNDIKHIKQNTKIKTKVAISEFKKLDIATFI
nr:MAG TPA: tail protein [Caudoviricetes sp.]